MEDRHLFKGKRVDNGEWVQGYLFDDGFENGRVFIGGLVIEKYIGTACDDWTISGSCFFEVYKSTICQCTGMKDKNGKLIWENDILNLDEGINAGCFWDEVNLEWGLRTPTRTISLCSYSLAELAVIDNIFDNKELLESEG